MGSVPPTLTYSCCSRLLLLKKSISKMDIASKNEFIYFMQRAVEDQSNDCYIELYNLLLRAFVSADADFDGQVSQDEFGGMISAAAALPKKLDLTGGRETLRICSRPSTRTATVPFLSTSG